MPRARQSGNDRSGFPRWAAWGLGAVALGVALWALGTGSGGPEGPPLDDIDAASRERLDAVLREADNESAAR
ncbi:MAG: hypothetical protein AAF430_24035 [Myxococcota bacterium]